MSSRILRFIQYNLHIDRAGLHTYIYRIRMQWNLHNLALYGTQNRCQNTEVVRSVKHDNWSSEYGPIRESVGLLRCWITQVPL